MSTLTVSWVIDFDTSDFDEDEGGGDVIVAAAQSAQATIRDQHSTATCFVVETEIGERYMVDLDPNEANPIVRPVPPF